jgi:hypothetical protein
MRGCGDGEFGQPAVTLADLGLRHVMAAAGHPVLDALDGQILGHQQHVQDDGVTRGAGGEDEVELRGR